MTFHRLPAEARLLLAGTREPEWDAAYVRSIAGEGLDWAQVRALATQERLLTVLWRRLSEAGISVPDPHGPAFRMQASVTEFQLSFAEIVLRQVVRTSKDLGVQLLLLKGAALAMSVYGSFRNRPMGDLDVLARPGDARRLWNALREDGWELEYEGGAEFYADHHHLPPLVRGGGIGVVLEIHRSLLPPRGPFASPGDLTWAAALTLDTDEGPVRLPDPVLQLLHLSVHFAWSHAMGRGLARTVRDVSAVVGAASPDWDALVDLADRTRASTSVYWTLRLASSLGDVRVPASVLGALRPSRSNWVLTGLERAYVEGGLFRSCPFPRLEQEIWALGIDPKGSGHGRSRPWATDAQFRTDVDPRSGHGARTSVSGRLSRVPAGLAYLGRVVTGSFGGDRLDLDA